MARLPRFFVPNTPLHVVQRGNNRAPIFVDTDDFAFFRLFLRWPAARHGLAIHAYVFMTNHIHLLATPDDPAALPKVMQALGRLYVQYFNRRYRRTGTLWEGRYRCTVVDHERYLFACMRYIELNPVRAGIVRVPDEYRWSSYAANAAGAADDLVQPHPLYAALERAAPARQAAYRAMFRDALSDDAIRTIRDSTQHAWALGGGEFKQKITDTGRRADRLPLGRPCESAPVEEDKSSLTLL